MKSGWIHRFDLSTKIPREPRDTLTKEAVSVLYCSSLCKFSRIDVGHSITCE